MDTVTLKESRRPYQQRDLQKPRIVSFPKISDKTLSKGIIVCLSYYSKVLSTEDPRSLNYYNKEKKSGIFVDEFRVYNSDQLYALYIHYKIKKHKNPEVELFWIK